MNIVFISNYFNHHQKSFCEAMYSYIGDDFVFVSTSQMGEERKKLGYGESVIPSYVKYNYTSPEDYAECQSLIDDADIVIVGAAREKLLSNRKKANRIIVRYAERPLKNGNSFLKYIPRYIRMHHNMHSENQYLFCSSGYTHSDYLKFGLFKNKAYKWGYFPQTIKYDISSIIDKKGKKKILWCGRFLDWKHPDDVILVGKKLREAGYDFEIDMIGTGPMEELLNDMIRTNGMEDLVYMLGSMKPELVREHMKNAGIYLFTSDFKEGWGAVLNESMNGGCAVVASHAIGSVPFLLKNNENGLIYKSGDVEDLYMKVKYLLDNPSEQERLGEQAYNTILDLWNADVAAKRFLQFVAEITEHKCCDLYDKGPCSRAEIINNNWFR